MIPGQTRPRRRQTGALCKLVALLAIGATIAWAATRDSFDMMRRGRARLEYIALLFICVEFGTLVSQFVAIDIRQLSVERIVAVSMGVLVLTLAALALQIAGLRFVVETDRD